MMHDWVAGQLLSLAQYTSGTQVPQQFGYVVSEWVPDPQGANVGHIKSKGQTLAHCALTAMEPSVQMHTGGRAHPLLSNPGLFQAPPVQSVEGVG